MKLVVFLSLVVTATAIRLQKKDMPNALPQIEAEAEEGVFEPTFRWYWRPTARRGCKAVRRLKRDGKYAAKDLELNAKMAKRRLQL